MLTNRPYYYGPNGINPTKGHAFQIILFLKAGIILNVKVHAVPNDTFKFGGGRVKLMDIHKLMSFSTNQPKLGELIKTRLDFTDFGIK